MLSEAQPQANQWSGESPFPTHCQEYSNWQQLFAYTKALALIQDQTNYKLTTSNADLVYEGEISTYRISPTTATAENTAAQNRLTIAVKVRFYNKNNEEDDLEQTFSFFYDYPGSDLLTGSQKTTAHEEIFDRLTQDIINATLAKWQKND